MKRPLYIFIITAALCACSGKKQQGADAMQPQTEEVSVQAPVSADADSLYALVEAQTRLGPRTPGSAAHAACRELITSRLQGYGADTVMVQQAQVTTFDGSRHTAYNITGRFNAAANDRVLLLAHYDTRPWADRDPDEANRKKPIDGANDGASGVAALLEIARVAGRQLPEDMGIDLLFIDMEDSGTPADAETADSEDSWALGAQQWVKDMPYTQENRPRYAILLDMVGGRDARFHREYFSQRDARTVVDRIWSIAHLSGLGDRFPNSVGGAIVDDHLHINSAGIPCVDIIENSNPQTGSFNPTWHTMADNLSNIDRRTLADVTQVVLNTIYPTDKQHTAMTINDKQDEIIEEFASLDDWMDRYGMIIDMGNTLPPIAEKFKTPEHLIEGCQSRVWLNAELTPDGKVDFTADSDAIIVKGIISMLVDVLSGHTPQDILDADLYFIDRVGLSEHLSPTRSNGLAAMVKQMRLYALAFKAKLDGATGN